jgi:hypothetical protein
MAESDWTPLFKSPNWRFSLRQLLIAIALIAVGLFALRSASPFWVMVSLSLTLLVLAASPLVALYRQGPERAFWIGFATIGWFYMLVLLYCWNLDRPSNYPLRADQLLTTNLSYQLHQWMYPLKPEPLTVYPGDPFAVDPFAPPPTISAMLPGSGPIPPTTNVQMPPPGSIPGRNSAPAGPAVNDFINVAHSIWTLLLAFCGGQFCKWLYATRPQSILRTAPPQA